MNERVAHTTLLEAAAFFVVLVLLAALGMSARPLHRPSLAQAAAREQSKAEEIGFYCNLKALSTEERARHKQLTQKLKLATVETKELPSGFGLRLDKTQISLPEVAEWISAEHQCCPFFDFDIELQRNGGPLWLKLSGKDGVKAFMRQEFGIQ
jgi:hypothetical protein